MGTNLKITSVVIFFISAYLIIPKIADAAGTLKTASANGLSETRNNSLSIPSVNSQVLQDTYIPPNYGGPDSQHGSGTR
jgi:hypothetical protein